MRNTIRLIVLVLATALILTACTSPHVKHNSTNIDRAYMHLSIKDESLIRDITGSELEDLVKWFNNSSGIHPNPSFKGAATIVGLEIELRDKRRISILDSGDNFEVQVSDPVKGKTVSYWAKENHIELMLEIIDNVQ